MGRLLAGDGCLVLGAGRVSIEKGTFWVSGWLAGLGCVSVWVIAAGQERSPVHGAGTRLIEDARCQMPAARGSSIPRPAQVALILIQSQNQSQSQSQSLGEPEPSTLAGVVELPTCVRGLSQGSLAGLTRGARLGNPWLRLLSCGSSPGQGFSERDVDSSLGTSGRLAAVENRRRRPMSGQPIWNVRILLSAACVSGWWVCV